MAKTFILDSVGGDETLRISALGLYRCFINGRRVGNDLLTPGWTCYDDRIAYQSYDVSALLKPGKNRLEIWLGDGWYRSRLMWSQNPIPNTWGNRSGAFAELGCVPCILEGFVPFTGEVSLIAVRARDGQTRFYPLVHNTHINGILSLSVASSAHPLQALAEDYVSRVLDQLNYVGVLAFEFFEVDGGLKANEIAPRVHNSGHWTIEGAECSQFENHLRAITGLPLGSTAKLGESAMLNFIGEVPPVAKVIAVEDCHLHHYGKAFKVGRKVGHATLRCPDRATLDRQITAVESLVERD
ncbi:MAG: hypothetical protein B7Z23_00730 [Pseudomonadales bacterium 32-61-5]|nr:MAG: hypothetical protein B7Z23_00730 [Pseudomonadales bacterium 32-61-5]